MVVQEERNAKGYFFQKFDIPATIGAIERIQLVRQQ